MRLLLGDRLPLVERYARMLADQGVVRGLVGPREVPRLWERHLLNSAAVAPFLPDSGTVVDLGSGAGLPGVVLACLRPDLHVVLVEPMLRRCVWLEEVAGALELSEVEVRRGRAEELTGQLSGDVVTARAVAPLDRLAGWALPLCRVGGSLLALKGERAQDELDAARPVLAPLGGDDGEVLMAPTVPEIPATSVVRVRKVAPGVRVTGGGPPSRQERPGRRAGRSARRQRS
ncbi:16S rRNA (guanine(527)-N(7))-methyltransferase RsmG [Actinotalea sp. Marseille-Q4924]|uniref:16S rRNA (guanine(527)-N(7))-methyltransferase RsmG n=1 Tax=Actinotalea sp. Marseille-Q4924 TaxID=2866571 RepID=UPI001CE41715|nr:16S rRNA (guanine(527)-N(7))-methyltransferase RsmG [Actinotalea sp. Marseille-Q4924]